jgi:hypothetical protein
MMSCRLADRKFYGFGAKTRPPLRGKLEEFQVAIDGGIWVAAGARGGSSVSRFLEAA